MKYYGLKRKKQREDFTYCYARTSSKVKSILPGKHSDYFKRNYKTQFRNDYTFSKYKNGIPDGHWLKLEQIVMSDLIYREEIGKLQKGVRKLLKQHRAGDRFFALPIEGLQQICDRIDQMDSSLLSWYDSCKCGVFDFRGEQLESSIDYFSVQIKNINSSYLSLEFRIFLTKGKMKELERIINEDYHDPRGYAQKTLTSPKNGGAFSTYTIIHYNDEFMKADRISDWLSCIEWDFYNSLKKYFPFVLHNQGLIPPRIEVFYTDIDYHEDNRFFWNSLGISDYQGQFIDESQKVFFDHAKTKDDEWPCPRLMYIINDDGIEAGKLESVKDEVYYHIEEYACEYFRFFFLSILSHDTGKKIVKYKHRLDKIKLKRNRLREVLKLRYFFERDMDPYIRYARDDLWKKSVEILEREIYHDSDEIQKKIGRHFYTSYKDFCNGSLSGAKKIDEAIATLRSEFDNKEQVLQHLADYKNSSKNWRLNIVMLLIAAVTLFFVVFPASAEWVADIIRNIIDRVESILRSFKQ